MRSTIADNNSLIERKRDIKALDKIDEHIY